MTAIRKILALTDRLVVAAETEGIEVGHISLHQITGISLYAEQDDLTPALAVALGLTHRHVMSQPKDTHDVEFFDAELDGVNVSTHHRIARLAVAS